MKSRILVLIDAISVLAALAMPVRLAAQQYTVTNLGTLGGTQSLAYFINNAGWVSGGANLPGDQNQHAFLWRKGVMTDLGTLGGPNSHATLLNERGEVPASADTSTPDPLEEDFCGFGTHLICLPLLWNNGIKTALPTLGGNNADPAQVNNRGQVVGFAETATHDPTCIPPSAGEAPQVLDFEAVIWGPKPGQIQELPAFPGDTVAAALGINGNGQVIGLSGVCAPISLAVSHHAVLWQNGSVTDLGNLGGVMNNAPFAINSQGQIAGLSDLTGDMTFHAFLWQTGVMTDLGTLPGDFSSLANDINDNGQVVGQSCDVNGNCRAFLWQAGVMTDLNTLTPPGSLYLLLANGINSLGEIVGQAFDQSTGEMLAFLATPTLDGHGSHPSVKVTLPDSVRERLRQRRGFGRFGASVVRPQ